MTRSSYITNYSWKAVQSPRTTSDTGRFGNALFQSPIWWGCELDAWIADSGGPGKLVKAISDKAAV